MNLSHIVISHEIHIPLSEIIFRTSRSGGPGGQNVNKLETRVEVIFDVEHSPSIPDELRRRIMKNLSSQLDSSGLLHVVSQDTRSQWKNKQLAIERLSAVLKSALRVRKKRIATKPTLLAREKRLRTKKARSRTKQLRKVSLE